MELINLYVEELFASPVRLHELNNSMQEQFYQGDAGTQAKARTERQTLSSEIEVLCVKVELWN